MSIESYDQHINRDQPMSLNHRRVSRTGIVPVSDCCNWKATYTKAGYICTKCQQPCEATGKSIFHNEIGGE